MADEPWAFWWELVEMTRRLVLVGFFVLVSRGSILQVVLGSAFCAVYMLVALQVRPFKEMADDFLASVASFSLLIFFMCCTIFKVGRVTALNSL